MPEPTPPAFTDPAGHSPEARARAVAPKPSPSPSAGPLGLPVPSVVLSNQGRTEAADGESHPPPRPAREPPASAPAGGRLPPARPPPHARDDGGRPDPRQGSQAS